MVGGSAAQSVYPNTWWGTREEEEGEGRVGAWKGVRARLGLRVKRAKGLAVIGAATPSYVFVAAAAVRRSHD